jgi:hypothetical protein
MTSAAEVAFEYIGDRRCEAHIDTEESAPGVVGYTFMRGIIESVEKSFASDINLEAGVVIVVHIVIIVIIIQHPFNFDEVARKRRLKRKVERGAGCAIFSVHIEIDFPAPRPKDG